MTCSVLPWASGLWYIVGCCISQGLGRTSGFFHTVWRSLSQGLGITLGFCHISGGSPPPLGSSVGSPARGAAGTVLSVEAAALSTGAAAAAAFSPGGTMSFQDFRSPVFCQRAATSSSVFSLAGPFFSPRTLLMPASRSMDSFSSSMLVLSQGFSAAASASCLKLET